MAFDVDASQGQSSVGDRLTVSATTDDSKTAIASVKPNSRNKAPACPPRNDSGTKTAASVAVVVTTAKNTCWVPKTAAARAPSA